MVYLNKAKIPKGIPRKLQMRRIGPCKIVKRYGPSAYKIDLPKDMAISPIFNMKDLIPYKGTKVDEGQY